MSQIVKTKRQANFKDFKRFGAFKGLVEQKNLVFNTSAKKGPIYTQTRQINYYYFILYQISILYVISLNPGKRKKRPGAG
jgi:hypothetical protein